MSQNTRKETITARSTYNDIVDSSSSCVGKLLFQNFVVRSSSTMREHLRSISNRINLKVQTISQGVDMARDFQEYILGARQPDNRESKIVTLNSLVYCEVVLGLFEQFAGLAHRNQLKDSGLASENAIQEHFQPLLSLCCYILTTVALECSNDSKAIDHYELLALEDPKDVIGDGNRDRRLSPLQSWINGSSPDNEELEGNLDIHRVVKWIFLVGLLTGYHGGDSTRPNRCFRSGHPYFCVPKVKDLVEMLKPVLSKRLFNKKSLGAKEASELYQKKMERRNKLISPEFFAKCYGECVFPKLKALAQDGFFDELAGVKVPDRFQRTNNSDVEGWPKRPTIKM